MRRGGKFLTAGAVLAMAACGMDQGKLEIRSTPSALARGERPVSQRIAEARGQLALGNVALALEAFRIAWREDPNSIDALSGMAGCYDQMGRFDLSRRYYETALALAPADRRLLGAFAASLQLQGRNEEALKVRQEIAARSAPVAEPAPQFGLRNPAAPPAPELAGSGPAAASPAIVAPNLLASSFAMEPVEAPVQASAPIPRPEFAAPPVHLAEAAPPATVPVTVPAGEKVYLVVEAPQAVAPAAVPQASPLGPSVSMKLPPARRIEPVAPASAPVAPAPKPAAPAAARPDRLAPLAVASADAPALKPYSRPIPQPSIAKEQGPKLERLSMGEIGLVTISGPVWRSTTVARTATTTKVRFIPLREASAAPLRVRLLNAARVDRLAARTRNWLIAKGWRGLDIGNSWAPRKQSVVLYPANKRWLAQRVAAQFGFAIAPRPSGRQVTVLLGSDAARHPALRRRGS